MTEASESSVPPPPQTPSDPIYMASFFLSEGDPANQAFHYTRGGNPNWTSLEHELGALEAAEALVFASGMAAIHAVLLALTPERPQVLLIPDGYFEVRHLSSQMAGVEALTFDPADESSLRGHLAARPSVVLVESPTNPLLRVIDLQRLARIVGEYDGKLVVDNTVATAVLQKPLDLGAVASVYSLTKAISGHSDLLMGAVVTRDPDLLARVRDWRTAGGAIAGPFEAWLALRGLRTLALRIERQSSNALELARHLARHPRVRAVYYPGVLEADRSVADVQMKGGYGPLLSLEVDGSAGDADAVVSAARLIRPGTSFGGVETTWERRARWPSETAPASLIRVSAGIEPIEDLVADVDGALGA